MIIGLSINVSASFSLIDEQDDIVKTWIENDTIQVSKNHSKPSVDIDRINVNIVDDQIIEFRIVLFGPIQNDSNTHYVAWYNTSTSSYYVHYTNGMNTGWAQKTNHESERTNEVIPSQVGENIIRIRYDLLDNDTQRVDFWGYATTINNTSTWTDIVPNSRNYTPIHDSDPEPSDPEPSDPEPSNNENETIDETKGFTIFIALLAFIIGLIWKKKQSWKK